MTTQAANPARARIGAAILAGVLAILAASQIPAASAGHPSSQEQRP